MKKLLLLATLVSMMTSLYGDDQKPETRRDSILTGPKDVKHVEHYLSVYGDTQTFTGPVSGSAIAFTHNEVRSFGFEHPVNGDNTKVEVNHKGIYFLAYNLGVTTSISDTLTAVLTVNGDPVLSTTRTVSATDSSLVTLNDTTIIKLKRGDVVQLSFTSSAADDSLSVVNPSLIITQISGS